MTLHYFLKTMTASIAQQKIRIRLKAFDRRMLDLSCDKIIQTADTTSASAIGPIPLPTKRKIIASSDHHMLIKTQESILKQEHIVELLIFIVLLQKLLML